MARPLMTEISRFIIDNVDTHPLAVGSLAAERFGVSRTTISKRMGRLIEAGVLEASGNTRARAYKLIAQIEVYKTLEVTSELAEDVVWREHIQPAMKDVSPNIINICAHGFTEIFNNVIDHAESNHCSVYYSQDAKKIKIQVHDYGVGIFEKIKNDFNLYDHRQALLELSKGKLTSDPSKHTGEGIFFASRMFNRFVIDSKEITYLRLRDGEEWLVEIDEADGEITGTLVTMEIDLDAIWTAQDIFDKYIDDNNRFSVTHVPLTLAKYPEEQLVSRSQAKRLLARVDRFSEVYLDFAGVNGIGQAFADEIFRVFKNEHPDVKILAVGAGPQIQRMIDHAKANGNPGLQEQLPLL